MKWERMMQLIQLKIIAQKESPRLKISPEMITQFQSENDSDPLAKIKQIIKMTAKSYPIHTNFVWEIKMTLKLKTKIILYTVTRDIIPKSDTYPSSLTDRDTI